MAVIEQTPISNFTGNGVTTVFAFDFLVPLNTDLLVIVGGATQALGTDYTVAGTGVSSGGTVTFTAAPASGVAVSVVRNIPATRSTDYQENGDLLADVLNDDFDRIVLMVQDATAVVGVRAVRGPVGESLVDLPPAASRANTTLGFDSNGQPTVLTPTSGSAADVLTRLADATDVAKGPALVAFRPTLNYVAGTIGHAIEYSGVTPSMFAYAGTVDPTGATDSTTALLAWASSGLPLLGDPGARYKVSAQITLPINVQMDGRGMVIDASAGGAFADSSVVYCSGALTALPALNVSPTKGGNALSFAAAHGLALNDVALIYNPTNSSFNAARTYYRAGEFFRVMAAPTGSSVATWWPLWAGYTAGAVSLYKLTQNRADIRGLKIIAPNTGSIRPLRVRLATSLHLADIECSGSDYVGIELDRCFDVEAKGLALFEQPSAASDEYGLSIGNSQNVRIIGGTFHALRHAVAIGGDDITGCVPCRNVRVIGATLSNDPTTAAPAADIHGNAEDIEYQNCVIFGGASFAGLDNAYTDCTFNDTGLIANALIVGGSECMGGMYTVRGGTLRSDKAFSLGLVRGSNGATCTVKDSHLVVEGLTVDMPNCDTLARFDMGTAAFKANASIRNIYFTRSGALINVLRMVGTGAAGDGDSVIVDGIDNGKLGASLYIAVNGYGATVRCKLMQQTGTVNVPTVAAAVSNSATVAFPYGYGSKIPRVIPSIDTRIVGTHPLNVATRLKSATQVTLDVFTTDNANAGAVVNVAVDYIAGVSET